MREETGINMEPVISIIVPVYKVEQYIHRCIDSILCQTFQDFELILVDDGSPDNCGAICDEYALLDNRIRVIHKENGGLSDARNVGIDNSRGKYIGFVDSDDYIAPDMYEVLYKNIIEYNADISMCGYYDCYENRIIQHSNDNSVYSYSQEEAIKIILDGKLFSVHAWTKLYKREIFANIRYPKGKICEDAYIIMDIMKTVNTAVFTPTPKYYYVHRSQSINTSKFSPRDFDRIDAHERNYEIIKNEYPNLKKLAHERCIGAYGYVAHKLIYSSMESNHQDMKRVFAFLRKNIINIIFGTHFSIRRKASLILMMISKKMYKKIMQKIKVIV